MNECQARPVHLMSTAEIRTILKDANLKKFARNAGVSYATVRSIVQNPKADPKQSTLATISDYLAGDRQ